MKKYIIHGFLCLCFILSLTACNMATPENYFDQAVLNSNMLVSFGDKWEMRQMEPAPEKLDPTTHKTIPVKRIEVLGDKVNFIEECLTKIKALKETAETKEMLQTSIALYEYIIPVYKKEYMELAGLYDASASKELVAAKSNYIHDTYLTHFNELYGKLIAIGKTYAAKNNILVNWKN